MAVPRRVSAQITVKTDQLPPQFALLGSNARATSGRHPDQPTAISPRLRAGAAAPRATAAIAAGGAASSSTKLHLYFVGIDTMVALLATRSIGIADLREAPAKAFAAARDETVVVLNQNAPQATSCPRR